MYTNDPFPYRLAAAGSFYANLSAMPPAEMRINGLNLPPASSGAGLPLACLEILAIAFHPRADHEPQCTHQLELRRAGGNGISPAGNLICRLEVLASRRVVRLAAVAPNPPEITEWSADQKNGTYSITTFENPICVSFVSPICRSLEARSR